jgi:hypothetical protein
MPEKREAMGTRPRGEARRAGGFIDRNDGKGWVVDPDPPKHPAQKPREPTLDRLAASSPKVVGGYRLVAEESPAAEQIKVDERKTRRRKQAAKKAAATRTANRAAAAKRPSSSKEK